MKNLHPSHECLNSLSIQESPTIGLVSCVISAFLALALTGCVSGTVKMGERIGGRLFEYAVFSPDSRSLATSRLRVGWWGPLANEGIVLDVGSRRENWRFHPDKNLGARLMTGLTYTSDGHLLATYLGNNSAIVWEASASNLVCRVEMPEQPGWCVLSPDGRWLATAGKKQCPAVWDVATARKLAELTNGPIRGAILAFSHEGRWLAAAGLDQGLCLWDATSGQRVCQLPSPRGQVRYLAFSPDDSRLAVSADDVSIFCLTNSESPNNLRAPSLSAGAKATAVIFSLAATLGGWPAFPSPEVFAAAPSGPVEFSPSGDHLAIVNSAATLDTALGKDAQQVRVFDFAHSNLLSTMTYNTRINSLACSPDGRWIATAGDLVEIWNYTDGRLRQRPTAYQPVVVCLQTNFSLNAPEPSVHTYLTRACVGAFKDDRHQQTLGQRTALGTTMSDIFPSKPVEESIRAAVAACFSDSSQRDDAASALNLTGTVTKFSVQTPASFWTWHVDAEVELELRLTDAAGNLMHSAVYHGQAQGSSSIWPSQSLIEKTCNNALHGLLENIQADPAWAKLKGSKP